MYDKKHFLAYLEREKVGRTLLDGVEHLPS